MYVQALCDVIAMVRQSTVTPHLVSFPERNKSESVTTGSKDT